MLLSFGRMKDNNLLWNNEIDIEFFMLISNQNQYVSSTENFDVRSYLFFYSSEQI